MATFSNSDPYLAIERALRAARSRAPANEGPRSRQMWDQYQADREPYGNRPWRPTPGPVITERQVEAVADELGVSDEEAAELIRQTAQAARGDASDSGWMAEGLAQYGMLNAAIQQAPTLRGIAETFSKVGKPETWSTPEKAALTPATPPTPQSVAPFSPAAVPSPPQSLEEFAAEMGRAQMAAANYNPQGIATEEAPGIETEPAEPSEPAEDQGPEAQYEETDRTGMFASPSLGRSAAESPSRFNEMFTQPQSLLALLEPPTPAQAPAPSVQAARAGDPGLGRTPGFASRGLAAAAINPEEVGIPGPDIAGARAAGLAAGVGLPGLAYAPASPAFDVPTPALAYAPSVPAFESVSTPGIAYAPGMPAFDEVETPAVAYNPQAPVAEVTGPGLAYNPQAPVAQVTTPGLAYAPSLPALPAPAISPASIDVDEAETPGPNMAAARAAAAAQAALSAPEFSIPGPNMTAAQQAAAASAANRQAVSDLETALIPTPLSTPNNASAVGRGVAGPANEMAAAQDYGFDPATIRAMTPGQRVTERARGLTANTAPRSSPISGIVMHETFGVSGMPGGVISAANERGAGYHYVIDIEGNVHQMVPENQTIAHIGDREVAAHSNSSFRNANTVGIGIQTHAGTRPNAAQMRAAAGLARSIAARHGIDVTTGVVGHGDLASRGQGPSAEGRSAVNALRGMPNEDTRAETGPDRPRTVDPLTRTTPGRRAGIEGVINAILGIQSAAAAEGQPSTFSAEGNEPAEQSAPAVAPAIAGLGFTPIGITASEPSAATGAQGGAGGGSSSAPGETGLGGGSTPGATGLGTGGLGVAGETAGATGQGVGGAGTGTGVGQGQTGSPTGAGVSEAESPEGQGIGSSSLGTGTAAPTEVGLQGPESFAETVAAMLEQGMITEEEANALNALNTTTPAFNAPAQFAPQSMAMYSAPNVQAALSQMTPPGMPAYASFRSAQEQGIEGIESEESEESQGIENSFSNAFSDPSAFSGMAGLGTSFSGMDGIGLGTAPSGVDVSGPAETGGMFGGVGMGQAAAETSASQMSSLGLEGMFSQGFENPGQYSGVTSNDPSPSSSEDADDATGPSGPAGPSSAADAAAGVGVDTSSSQDGPGTGTGTGADPSGGGNTGVGDNTGGMNGGFDGAEGGGMGGGTGGTGGGGGGTGGTGEGASDNSSGGGWAWRGGHIDETFQGWTDADRDRAILRAILAAERMHSRDRKARGGYVMPFARFADGGEIVENSVEYTPNGVIYSQVVQRALNAAKRRNAA